jgi:hypothetical protein
MDLRKLTGDTANRIATVLVDCLASETAARPRPTNSGGTDETIIFRSLSLSHYLAVNEPA